ncbi:1259_t:CDS:2 [Entrophospora sp. SA101]|nr:1259_t:CDS:2 [Entrophospora sp. SA101]
MDGYMQNNDLDTISSSNNNFNDNNVIGEILEKEVQWEYAKRALGAIGALGEASKVFDQLITQIQEVINQIQTIYEATQYNKRVCDLLMDRVECLEISLRTLKRNKEDFSKSFLQQHYYDNFLRLINNLNKIKKFISDISLLNGLRKYNHNFYEIKNQFKDIVSEFERVVDQLGFNLGYLLDEQHRKDSDALNEEIDELKKFLDMVGGGITGKDKNINLIFETNTRIKRVKVACKSFDSDQNARFYSELILLEDLNKSEDILKFYGTTEIPGECQNLVFEWCENNDLQSLYETYQICWYEKLSIALGICRGLIFLHGCQIFHQEIRCQNVMMTKDLSPKIANFGFAKPTKYSRYVVQDITAVVHWLAPEKLRQSKKAKFSHKCDVFSFGMLLWEFAFDKIPYKDLSYTQIIEHIKSGKREIINFGGDDMPWFKREYAKLIRAAWQDDPCLRPGLYQVFLKLYDLLQKYQNEHPNEVSADISQKLIIKEGGPKTIDDDSSMNVDVIDDKKIDFHDPDLDVFPKVKSVLLLEDGIKSHKSNERKSAWECFEYHAKLGNNYAKYWQAHYLTEGYHVEKDVQKGTKYFKEAADCDVADSQLRYAFSLYHDQIIQDTDAFLNYLTLAADNGNATAQFNMGRMYYGGMVGLKKDVEKGLQFLKMAALKNQPKAVQFLSNIKVDRCSSNLAHRACVFINSNDNQVINNGSHHSFMKPPFPPKINIKDLFIRHKSQKTKITSASTTTSLDDKSISSLRSPNAFILYRTMFFQTARSQGYQLPMTVVSAMASKFWKQEPKYVQDEYKRIAKEAKKFRDELIPSNKINRRNKKKDATFAPNTFSNFDYYLDMMNDREYPSPDLSTGNDNFVNTNESTTTTFDQDPDLNIFGLQYLNF